MDPMVGFGGKKGQKCCTGAATEEDNSNSNVISLLEVCCMCNRRFLFDNLDPRGNSVPGDDHCLKEEDILLRIFFDDIGSFEKSLLQFCTFCKTLFNSLIETKEKLSKTIDEISKLIRKSKKLSTGSSYLLSKPRVVTRLFQDHTVRAPSGSTTYLSTIPGIETDFASPTKEYFSNSTTDDEFTAHRFDPALSNNNTNSSSSPIDKTHSLISSIPSDSGAKAFSFLSPIRISSVSPNIPRLSPPVPIIRSQKLTVDKMKKKTPLQKDKSTKKDRKSTKLVTNSCGRFVLVQEHEENARDVGDSSDCHNLNILAGLAHQHQALLDEAPFIGEGVEIEIMSTINPQEDLNNINNIFTEVTETSRVDDDKDNNGNEVSSLVPVSKYICHICSKVCARKRDLVNHIESHTKVKPFICEICGASYRHKGGLESHLAIHRGEGKHKCPHCNQMFTQKAGLKRHLPLHTGESRYQCEECGKNFLHHSSFAHHKMVHSGERNFKCSTCSQCFSSSTHLKRHERIHTGQKPFTCSICDKSFNEKSNLKAHMRTHTKESAHTCPYCSKGFNRKHKLERHVYTFHPEDEDVKIEDDENNEDVGIGKSNNWEGPELVDIFSS